MHGALGVLPASAATRAYLATRAALPAHQVYRKAQREGCGGTLMVYSAAVYACIQVSTCCIYKGAERVHAERVGTLPLSETRVCML